MFDEAKSISKRSADINENFFMSQKRVGVRRSNFRKSKEKVETKCCSYGTCWVIKSSIFQSNQVIRMINLKASENKAHKSLKLLLISHIVKDGLIVEISR